jgi:hypothetical protein
MDSFHVQHDEGCVGHCILVFYGVKSFHMSVSPYDWENGKAAWRTPIETHHESNIQGETNTFGLAGRLHGFLTWVDIAIEAQKFEIHILEKDEPKKRP